MESQQTAGTFSLNPSYSLEALQEELVQLNSDLSEANEQRAQAAEYGLLLLEEKQALEGQYEELSNLYESTKRELDSSTNVSRSGCWGRGSCDCGLTVCLCPPPGA